MFNSSTHPAKIALRSALCCVLVAAFPVQMLAGESPTAMLYTSGAAWVNGAVVPKTVAVFSGDTLQTPPTAAASIQGKGSSVTVMADSLVKFEGSAVEIEHGGVRVTTAAGMEAHAGEVTIRPAGAAWTEFQVVDVDGEVHIAANKGDVTVQDAQGTTTVTQGQQATRDESADPQKKKKKRRGAAVAVAARGGIMNSPWAVYGGTGAIAGVGIWLLLRDEGPISPSCPTTPCQ